MDKGSGEDPQDARIRSLWTSLGAAEQNNASLDYEGLRAGLYKIDHRLSTSLQSPRSPSDPGPALKEASHLLTETLKRADRNGDGKIRYSGTSICDRPTGLACLMAFIDFSSFVRHADRELRQLFVSIDRDKDGKLTKEELQVAFHNAGIPLTSDKLDHFFNSLDRNHDGVISFDEWRYVVFFLYFNHPD